MFKNIDYRFPVIRNISDVLPHIEGEDAFRVITKGDVITIDYAVLHSDVFRPMGGGTDNEELTKRIRRECRGISFDRESGNIIRRPMHKFFNINEREETMIDNINLVGTWQMDKLDGSNISSMIENNSIILGTRAGVTDVSELATKWVNMNPNRYKRFFGFIDHWEAKGFTVIFEFYSDENQVVIDYGKPAMEVLAIRDRVYGNYVAPNVMFASACEYMVPCVKYHMVEETFDVKSIHTMVDIEGFVFRDGDGHMVKQKTEWYCALHGLSTNFVRNRDIVKIWIDGNLDDLYPNMSKQRGHKIREFMKEFEQGLEDTAEMVLHDIKATLWEGDTKSSWAKRHFKEFGRSSRFVFEILGDDNVPFEMRNITKGEIMNRLIIDMYAQTGSNRSWDRFVSAFPKLDKVLTV